MAIALFNNGELINTGSDNAKNVIYKDTTVESALNTIIANTGISPDPEASSITEEMLKDIDDLKTSTSNLTKEDTVIKNDISSMKTSISNLTNADTKINTSINTINSNISTINTNINTINTKLNKTPLANNSNIFWVAPVGGQFTTISSAITQARNEFASGKRSGRVTIYIASGIYNETVDLRKNPGIDLVGAGKEATIVRKASVSYPDSPLRASGNGTIRDMSFKVENGNSYAFHYEIDGESPAGYTGASGTTIIQNCNFVAYNYQAIGIGMGADCRLEFHNCYFNSGGANAAFYCHNSPQSNRQNQWLLVKGCMITGQTNDGTAFYVEDQCTAYGGSNSKMVLELCGNYVTWGNFKFNKMNGNTYNTIPVSGDSNFTLTSSSYGNSVAGMNITRTI